jgi:hypothetical protein
MIYVFLVLLLLTMGFSIAMWREVTKARRSTEQLRAVVDSQHDYSFLVNRGFEVQQTNFPAYRQSEKEGSNVLGNVLHCKNAFEAGRCGEHANCKKCPIRFVINKSFDRGENFSNLEACMEVFGDKGKTTDIDVQVDGRIVSLEQQPHMVVNVRICDGKEQQLLPKVFLISGNVALYDRVRTALEGHARVLSADNLHQALHRLLMVASYHFLAVMIDEEFYEHNSEITKLLVENDGIKVIVFTSKETFSSSDEHVYYLPEDFSPEQLYLLLLQGNAA